MGNLVTVGFVVGQKVRVIDRKGSIDHFLPIGTVGEITRASDQEWVTISINPEVTGINGVMYDFHHLNFIDIEHVF